MPGNFLHSCQEHGTFAMVKKGTFVQETNSFKSLKYLEKKTLKKKDWVKSEAPCRSQTNEDVVGRTF